MTWGPWITYSGDGEWPQDVRPGMVIEVEGIRSGQQRRDVYHVTRALMMQKVWWSVNARVERYRIQKPDGLALLQALAAGAGASFEPAAQPGRQLEKAGV